MSTLASLVSATQTASTEVEAADMWKSTKAQFQKGGRWLITEAIQEDGYKGLLERINDSHQFKGTFLLHNFPKTFPEKVDFLMTDREISVGHIKSEVAKITNQSAQMLQISFKNFRPIADDADLYYGLCCHGKGGENFHLTLVDPPTEAKEENKHVKSLIELVVLSRNRVHE